MDKHELKVKGPQRTDIGRFIIRLNTSYRKNIPRYGVAKITNLSGKQSLLVLVLGHDKKDAIFMPYDIRTALNVQKGDKLSFAIEPVCFFGKLRWYLKSPDPAIYVPARLALFSVGFGVISIVLAFLT